MRYVRDRQSAEDAVQEVFEKLWKKRDSIHQIDNLEAYLRRSVVNTCLNHIKKDQRIDWTDQESDLDRTVSPLLTLETSELGDLIKKTIDGLPEKCRLVFVMSRYEEMSYKEIAQTLGVSVKTIENQISKALKRLRASVENYQKVN